MGNTPGFHMIYPAAILLKIITFSLTYPTSIIWRERQVGRVNTVSTSLATYQGNPFPSGRLIIYPGIEVGIPLSRKHTFRQLRTEGHSGNLTLPADELFLPQAGDNGK